MSAAAAIKALVQAQAEALDRAYERVRELYVNVPDHRAATTGCVGTGECAHAAWNIRTCDTYLGMASQDGIQALEYMHNGRILRVERAFANERCTADDALRAEVGR